MASTFTPNIQWEEPARGDDVGVWDTPVNNNGTLIDLITGAIATIPLNNSNVVLSAAQFRSKQITFNSTLTGNVIIVFPSSFTKSYEIQNLCTGSSAFSIQLAVTGGGQIIGCPPGETVDCFNDGTNMKFKNLGRVGQYWDYAGAAVPLWVQVCTIQPFLNCNGTTFSSATYPALATIMGTTTLPDIRGASRATLNQGTGRITAGQSGLDGDTNYSFGGLQTVTLSAGQIPAIQSGATINIAVGAQGGRPNIPVTDGSIAGTGTGGGIQSTPFQAGGSWGVVNQLSGNNAIVVNSNNTGGQLHTNMQPTIISGICLIRAA